MSQERTEQRDMTEIREAFYRMIKGEHSLHIPAQTSDEDFVIGAALDELESARAEIDRLNATIAGLQEAVKEQTAKVQEKDKTIESLTSSIEFFEKKIGEGLLAPDMKIAELKAKVQERDETIGFQADDINGYRREIERLRSENEEYVAALEEAEEAFEEIRYMTKEGSVVEQKALHERDSIRGTLE